MKVYVSELLKSCEECPFFNLKDGYCSQQEMHLDFEFRKDTGIDVDCPLQSLTDYTKQVRKEVCERLDKIIEKYLCKKGRHRESLDISSIIKQVMKEDLDQIQGEDK